MYSFLACVVNNNAHILDGGSIVLNVLVPPYVGESDWATDFCKVDGAQLTEIMGWDEPAPARLN